MGKKELRVWLMAKDWVMPFVASWRTFERTINPAFYFILRCGNCMEYNSAFVTSVKDPKIMIGIQCRTEGCGQTIKFEEAVDAGSKNFPERFKKLPTSILIDPDGKSADKRSKNFPVPEEVTKLLLDG